MLTLKDGTVDIELLPELAPQHVERIVDADRAGASTTASCFTA